MRVFARKIGFGIALALLVNGLSVADDIRELTWDDLIPDKGVLLPPTGYPPMSDEDLMSGEGFDENWENDWDDDEFEAVFSTPVYPTGVVEELDGQLVKIPGFIVPLEVSFEGEVSEFLLVPYFGACIHYPPPPPNQLVYITAGEPIDLESTWEPIWAIGELKTEFRESGLGSAGYTMLTQSIEKYEY